MGPGPSADRRAALVASRAAAGTVRSGPYTPLASLSHAAPLMIIMPARACRSAAFPGRGP
eukprot:577540-Hanusia_phi.AAC.1